MIRKHLPAALCTLAFAATPEAISIRSAEHYTWGECCDGCYLVKNGRMNIIQERLPPGSGETRHRHNRAQQFFYVLNGEAALELEGRTVTLRPGEGALVPPGAAHRLRNASDRGLEILVTSEPPSHGDRVEMP